MLQLIGRRRKGKKLGENALKGDIYNDSDFTARKRAPRFEMPRRAAVERRVDRRRKARRDGSVKKKKKKEGSSRTFESGIRSGPEETRRNVIIAAKDNLTGGSFPPRLLLIVRPRFLFLPPFLTPVFNTSSTVVAARSNVP